MSVRSLAPDSPSAPCLFKQASPRGGLAVAVGLALVVAVLPGWAEEKKDAKKKPEGKSGSAAQITAVEVMPVERRDLSETLNLVGSVAATESAQVRTEIAGVVREISIQEGQAVKKGQLLVKSPRKPRKPNRRINWHCST